MAVSVYSVVLLAATALGTSIALYLRPLRTSTMAEMDIKPSRILRNLKRVSNTHQELEKSSCGRVWVTVHAPAIEFPNGYNLYDAVELNWDFSTCSNRPTQIGLFDVQPSSWKKAIIVYPITSIKGYIVSNMSLDLEPLPGGWSNGNGLKGPHCMWPWIGAGGNEIDAYNCLKIQPTWMADNADKIGHLRIGELVIPGTHNAGAWRFSTEISSVARDNFILCQDHSIWAQLVHGIRYFDFRIGYYGFYSNENDRYWLNHNLIRVRRLVPLLKQIRVFLDSTEEVVFLDAHHLPIGFYEQNGRPLKEAHDGLLKIIKRELGPHLAYASRYYFSPKGPQLKYLRETNKRLLFSYIDYSLVLDNNWLWPVLPHLWANTNSPYELLSFLDRTINEAPPPSSLSPLFSAMAQTTPTILDIVFLRGSIRKNSDAVNRNVTDHLSTSWRKRANIVSTDFFMSNDVIDVAIAINIERSNRA